MGDDDHSEITTYSLTAERLSPGRAGVDTGDTQLEVGRDANPVEFFLAGVLGCLNSTGTMVARDMDIEIERMTATATGGIDYSSYRGEESDARPGLQDLDVRIDIDADADEATLQSWVEGVKRRCPVTDNVENETGLDIHVSKR